MTAGDFLEELKDIDNLTNNNLDEIDFFKKSTTSIENNNPSELEKKYTKQRRFGLNKKNSYYTKTICTTPRKSVLCKESLYYTKRIV